MAFVYLCSISANLEIGRSNKTNLMLFAMRDFNAVKRITTAYIKLLFPHWKHKVGVNLDEFDRYCLQPAIRRRGVIKEQCHNIDPEFKVKMPEIRLK
ncbi:MAG: BREX system Lon protease-like protein BrxL [Bacteroidota bacterium]|nr:BREX system Lon protease-like protein BrxL [Bacteroidota bacterium]